MKCRILVDDNLGNFEQEISLLMDQGYFLSHFIKDGTRYVAVLVKK